MGWVDDPLILENEGAQMNKYLLWLAGETRSVWWNDSADIGELEYAKAMGAQGVTTNPYLVAYTIYSKPEMWQQYLRGIPADLPKDQKAEEIIRRVTCRVAELFLPIYEHRCGMQGFVCAQVDPHLASNREAMLEMAIRMHKWMPNIAVKLPVTAAGLDVLEECATLGISVTATVSFTVSQTLEVGRRYQAGLLRAAKTGVHPGRCFAVIMVGRIDDYIRDVVLDRKLDIAESDILQCGTGIMKRAYLSFQERGYAAELMPAGMRGAYHAQALAGAQMSMSIHPKIQKVLQDTPEPYREMIDVPVDAAVVGRLMAIPEFVRAYEPAGIKPEDFITYGAVQKTLSQFVEHWTLIAEYPVVG